MISVDPARDLATLDKKLYLTYSGEDDVVVYGFPSQSQTYSVPSQQIPATMAASIISADWLQIVRVYRELFSVLFQFAFVVTSNFISNQQNNCRIYEQLPIRSELYDILNIFFTFVFKMQTKFEMRRYRFVVDFNFSFLVNSIKVA